MGSKGRVSGPRCKLARGSGEQGGFINLEFSDRIGTSLGAAHVDKKTKVE